MANTAKAKNGPDAPRAPENTAETGDSRDDGAPARAEPEVTKAAGTAPQAAIEADEKQATGSESPESSAESGEASESEKDEADGPPILNEPVPGASQAPTQHREEDDGWEFHWNPNTNSYWFFNRFTQVWQQENPRLQTGTAATTTISTSSTTASAAAAVPPPLRAAIEGPSAVGSVANGYNPAIHGDYDPNAWYAQEARAAEAAAAAAQEAATAAALAAAQAQAAGVEPRDEYESGGFFNARTGLWQDAEQGPDRHGDDARSRRQLNAFFDVDAAANMHDGRSLRAERAGKKPSRAELKAFKEKRKARKEEKRRAWLRD